MSKNTEILKTTEAPEAPSEKESIFGRKHGFTNKALMDPVADKGKPMGTAYLADKRLLPGGPGYSDKYSGPVELDENGVPIGLWFYPGNREQHANIAKYWIPAEIAIIQIKKTVA